MYDINELCSEKNFDINKLRLNIGGGNIRYSNCLNLELQEHPEVDADVYCDARRKLEFPDESFVEVLMIHVIEHIERKYHQNVFSEIWRVLKPNGRLVLGFPDFIECAKRFIENRFGSRWRYYNNTIYGRQGRKGDYHVTAIERQDITDRLLSAGFVNIKYLQTGVNATMTARKGEQLNYL